MKRLLAALRRIWTDNRGARYRSEPSDLDLPLWEEGALRGNPAWHHPVEENGEWWLHYYDRLDPVSPPREWRVAGPFVSEPTLGDDQVWRVEGYEIKYAGIANVVGQPNEEAIIPPQGG